MSLSKDKNNRPKKTKFKKLHSLLTMKFTKSTVFAAAALILGRYAVSIHAGGEGMIRGAGNSADDNAAAMEEARKLWDVSVDWDTQEEDVDPSDHFGDLDEDTADWVDVETTMDGPVRKASYWHRMLDENGTFYPPDAAEVADLLIEEIGHERDVNGTADAQAALIRIAEKVLGEAAKAGQLDESNLNEMANKFDLVRTDLHWSLAVLRKLLLFSNSSSCCCPIYFFYCPWQPEGSKELEAVDLAVLNATNQSACVLPGQCENKEHLIKVKNLIREMLVQYGKDGKEPDLNEIYGRLEEELGVDPKLADELIDVR